MTTEIAEIELHQPPPAFGLPNPSPFCFKLEAWLRLAGLPYRAVPSHDPRKGPKGKYPWVVVDGQAIGDTEFIIAELSRSFGADLDGHLDGRQRAAGHAIVRMVEENLYWALIYSRWMNETIWPILKRTFFSGLPPIVRSIAPAKVRKQVRRTLHGQGTGRHAPEEIYARADRDLAALDTWIGAGPYLMGDRPCTADATVFAFSASIYHPIFDTDLKAAAQGFANLRAYADRLRDQLFGADYGASKN